MVNSKKINKSTVAIVVLSLLLVLSLVLTATGAWFTDKATQENAGSVTFGTVVIDDSKLGTEGSIVTYRAADDGKTNVTPAMPGDKIDVTVDVQKTEASQHFYFTVNLQVKSIELAAGKSESATAMVAKLNEQLAAANAKLYCTDSTVVAAEDSVDAYAKTATVTLDGDTFTDTYQGATITFGYEVRAIQVANVSAANAKTLLTTKWNNGTPTLNPAA